MKNILLQQIFLVLLLCVLVITLNIKNHKISTLEEKIQTYASDTDMNNIIMCGLNDEINNQLLINQSLSEENEQMQELIDEVFNTNYQLVYLGSFTITYYCAENYPHICNDGDSTLTASGSDAIVGRTIAVDTSVIPFGTEVYIDGVGVRVAEDRGGAITNNRIDVLVQTHQEALNKGKETKDVWMIVKVS